MKIKIKLPNWLMTIGNYIWCWWSNLRWCKATKEYPLQEKDIATQDEADKIDRFYNFCQELLIEQMKVFIILMMVQMNLAIQCGHRLNATKIQLKVA